jgi:uncharacterized repeat protein (TIGR04042 family)
MPEMRFLIEWPSGEQQTCYSPSLVVKEHLEVGGSYEVDDFAARCQTALAIASERVREKFGFPCTMAQTEASRIAREAARFRGQPGTKVRVLKFIE